MEEEKGEDIIVLKNLSTVSNRWYPVRYYSQDYGDLR
jgi:hypothetical protein